MEQTKNSRVAGRAVRNKRQTKIEDSKLDMKDTYIEDQEKISKGDVYKRRIAMVTRAAKHDSISNMIADSKLFYKSYLVREMKKVWPHKSHMWYVDKYYPQACGGPLYIDEPNNEVELKDCKLKEVELRKLKVRYLILTRQTTLLEAAETLGIDPDRLEFGDTSMEQSFEVKRVE